MCKRVECKESANSPTRRRDEWVKYGTAEDTNLTAGNKKIMGVRHRQVHMYKFIPEFGCLKGPKMRDDEGDEARQSALRGDHFGRDREIVNEGSRKLQSFCVWKTLDLDSDRLSVFHTHFLKIE